jgi:hypothetical protein
MLHHRNLRASLPPNVIEPQYWPPSLHAQNCLENSMDRTTGLIVEIVAGFAGAHFAATALHEHRFGWLGHSLVGSIAGALSR